MDKVKKYRQLAKDILHEIANDGKPSREEIFYYVVEDEKKGHFLLFSDGWTDMSSRYYGCSVHVEVKDTGKVYLNYDMTDYEVGQLLMDRGVLKSDLVPAFQPPIRRAELGFATA